MAFLTSLPNELVQQIASYLPCSTVLNLLRVNRQLHNACKARLVFHNIAKHSLDISLLSAHGIDIFQTAWTDGEVILAKASLTDTISIASAAEKCMQALLAEDDE